MESNPELVQKLQFKGHRKELSIIRVMLVLATKKIAFSI